MSSCSNTAPVNGQPHSAFVADDEPLLLEMAQQLLQESGCSVRTFPSGESLLSALQNSSVPPELIVTDYAMTGISGLDVISCCRRSFPDIKIMLVSGTVNETTLHSSKAKPDAFLPKPYRAEDFSRLVASLLS